MTKRGDLLYVVIPVLPPGINATYGYGQKRVYLKPRARQWAANAALIIGAARGLQGWLDNGGTYAIEVVFGCGKRNPLDVDAPVKLVIDTVTRKLMMGPENDSDARVVRQMSERVISDSEFVAVRLTPFTQRKMNLDGKTETIQ